MCLSAGERTKTVFDAIDGRRSVRAYAQENPEDRAMRTLLEAAVRAPTAMHEEPWGFVVVQDRDILKRVSDLAKPLFLERLHGPHILETFSNPDFDIFHGAGTLVVICAKPSGPFVEADCWLAAENLMLAACALGLGSCVIGSSVAALNMPDVKHELGIPEEFDAVAPVVVGKPSGETPSVSRKEPLILSWRRSS